MGELVPSFVEHVCEMTFADCCVKIGTGLPKPCGCSKLLLYSQAIMENLPAVGHIEHGFRISLRFCEGVYIIGDADAT